MKLLSYFLAMFSMIAPSAFATVTVTSPTSGQTLNTPATYAATATTSTCSTGVASMGIYVDNVLVYVVNGAKLNTTIALTPGAHHTVVEEWDFCGGATFTTLDLTAAGQTGVVVTSPTPDSTVSSPVTYSATATTTCSKGVATMGVYLNNRLVYVVSGSRLDTQLSLNPGPEHTVVEEWDNCGGAGYTTDDITVSNAGPPTVHMTANPPSITLGNSSKLTITATNATQLTVTGSDGTAHTLSPTGGTLTVSPTASTTYYAGASGAKGNASAASLVEVAPPASAAVDYPRYKGDLGGTGANMSEVLLTPANVNSTHFGIKWGVQVDSLVTAQPLYVRGIVIKGVAHNALFVATNNDTVCAFDADTGAKLWSRNFLSSGVTPISLANLGYNNPFGILSTPVIDPATKVMYFVTWTAESNSTYFPHRLHAISLTTGSDVNAPVTISDPLMPPFYQFQRPALLLLNRTLYVGFGAVSDIPPYHGLLFAFDEATLAQKARWNDTEVGTAGGIWMSGAAPTADSEGNIYLSTGNGAFNGTTAFGESAVKLSPALKVLDYFTPFNYVSLSANDVDLGSGSVVVVPDQPGPFKHELITCGKPTPIYVLNRDNMGKLGNSSDKVIQSLDNAVGGTGNFPDSGQPCFNSPAVWNNSVYFAANHDVLKKFSISPMTGQLFVSSRGATTYFWPGADPVVSAKGTTNGIVWTIEHGSATLHASDATNVSRSLYVGPTMGQVYQWMQPTVVNGYVYVAAYDWIVAYTNQ